MTDLEKQEYKIALEAISGEGCVKIDEPIKNHTSIKLGGPADLLVTPSLVSDIKPILDYLKTEGIPYYVMGNGSNIFAGDAGYRGAIIKISSGLSASTVKAGTVIAEAGISLAKLAGIIAEEELTGFEFASGIPGTLGGAVFMNAGAYGGEMKDILASVKVSDEKGNILILDAKDLDLGYRHSLIQDKGWIVLEATMDFEHGKLEDIKAKMKTLNQRRKEKQPLDLPSAGSAFKRPTGYYAGKLIMDSGLSGCRVGGISVSRKHCGFIVNDQNGTADELIQLIEHIKSVVYEKYHVVLEPEMRRIR